MKKIFLLLFIFSIILTAQHENDRQSSKHDIDKFEQLEKIKLIELLNLDEQTTLKFFARRNESRNQMKKINDELHNLFRKVSSSYKNDNSIQNEEAEKYIIRIKELEKLHFDEREKFISNLNSLLSKEQILKYIVFENRFRDEVRKKFLNRRSKKVD